MPTEEDLLSRAEAGDRDAIEQVLREVHPSVLRAASALTGDADRAAELTDVVFRGGMRVLPQWSSWADPQTWFCHQTVQMARKVTARTRPDAAEDLLVTALDPSQRSAAYAAFVRAIRRLPPQQTEAFLLHHGERLNSRLIGVSMDCSTQAAQTHLKAADNAVRTLFADEFDQLTSLLYSAVHALGPTALTTEQFIQSHVGGWAGKRRRSRMGKLIAAAVVGVILLIAWFVLKSKLA